MKSIYVSNELRTSVHVTKETPARLSIFQRITNVLWTFSSLGVVKSSYTCID